MLDLTSQFHYNNGILVKFITKDKGCNVFAKERFIIGVAVLGFLIGGCSAPPQPVDTTKTIQQIEAEIGSMSAANAKKMADAFQAKITDKEKEVKSIASQLKGLSPQEVFGEKAKAITAQIAPLQKEVNNLKERYTIYLRRSQVTN